MRNMSVFDTKYAPTPAVFSEFPLQYCGGCHNAQKSPENFVQNTALEM